MTGSGELHTLSLEGPYLTLHLRSTRPYLNELEKRWIAFQVLSAMRDARAREVSLA